MSAITGHDRELRSYLSNQRAVKHVSQAHDGGGHGALSNTRHAKGEYGHEADADCERRVAQELGGGE